MVPVVIVALVGLTAGCSGSSAEAQAAYDACATPDAEINLVRMDGRSVLVELVGDDARVASGGEDAADEVATGELSEDSLSGLGMSMALLFAVECLVEETGYPGTSDQLTDGDEWDGWRYTETSGAGWEFTAMFESVS